MSYINFALSAINNKHECVAPNTRATPSLAVVKVLNTLCTVNKILSSSCVEPLITVLLEEKKSWYI